VTKKTRIIVVVIVFAGMIAGYYLIGRQIYLNAAKSAFPRIPSSAYRIYLPWPLGPKLIGQFEPGDQTYLERDRVDRDSQGMHLIIHDSDGTFIIE
jgi:hypothetical protein